VIAGRHQSLTAYEGVAAAALMLLQQRSHGVLQEGSPHWQLGISSNWMHMIQSQHQSIIKKVLAAGRKPSQALCVL
jgi:hypothetical protein